MVNIPDENDIAARRLNLSPAKRALLAQRLAGKVASGVRQCEIPKRAQSEPPPLSFAQQRLWFLDQLVPGNSFYNIPAAIRLSVPINVATVQRSINESVRRHDSLRTTFRQVDDDPVQIIAPKIEIEVPVIDLKHLPVTNRENEAVRLATEEAIRPFDLDAGPLIRVSLLKLAELDHILLLTMHHIISDGWSMALLSHEFSTLYRAFSHGHPSRLPELPIQYADFAVWQRNRLQGDVLEKQLAYWKKQLANLPVLALPCDRTRPATGTFRGAYKKVTVSASLVRKLRSLGQKNHCTLFITMLAAFQSLLSRYTGQADIAVGFPVANRTQPELEHLIGFFVNTLIIRTDFSGDPTFRELLGRVREVALAAYAHEDVPFEKLVEELQPERDLNRNPLYQVTFQIFSSPTGIRPEATLPLVEVKRGTSIFDLSFTLTESVDGLSGGIEYSTELFDASTINRMIEHYRSLLETIAENPDLHISEIGLLSAIERRQILIDWNATHVPDNRETFVDELVEAHARRNPQSLAVTCHHRQITYGELNRSANQLACRLQTLGVGPDALVGVCMERSTEMIIALLGILKAGGAYVPLDPQYPRERLAFMLSDAQVRVLLTQSHLIDQLPQPQSKVICLDSDWKSIARESTTIPPHRSRMSNLAYVIYTSGSTGMPKGVEISHRGLLNLIAWHQRTYRIGPKDRATQIATPAFDASVWEIWPYITVGASLHIPDEVTRATPTKLAEWLAREKITISFLPTPLAEELLAVQMPVGSLRKLLTGGDKLTRLPAEQLRFELVNHYGPTEASVLTTYAPVEVPWRSDAIPPIGRPIDNVRIYVVRRIS